VTVIARRISGSFDLMSPTTSRNAAIAVVEPVPAPPPKSIDPDPNNVILFLALAHYQERWVVANLAPLGVRSGYPAD
jgi:hypothetical protein